MDDIVQEQLAYYRARALEYDESLQGRRRVLGDRADAQVRDEIARARDALRRLGSVEAVLELACGTGRWTRELLWMARRITAVDGAPEMLAMARAKVADAAAVDFICADLFGWVPTSQYDLVMFAASALGATSSSSMSRPEGRSSRAHSRVRCTRRALCVMGVGSRS